MVGAERQVLRGEVLVVPDGSGEEDDFGVDVTERDVLDNLSDGLNGDDQSTEVLLRKRNSSEDVKGLNVQAVLLSNAETHGVHRERTEHEERDQHDAEDV